MLAGLIGSAISSLIMNKYKCYKWILLVCVVLGVIFHLLLYIILYQGSIVPSIIFAGIVGFFELPSRGLIVAFSCEVAYPVSIFFGKKKKRNKKNKGEAIIYGFSLVAYCLLTLAAAIGSAVFFEDADAKEVLIYGIVTSAFMAIGTILAFFVKGTALLSKKKLELEDLRKTKIENEEKAKEAAKQRTEA